MLMFVCCLHVDEDVALAVSLLFCLRCVFFSLRERRVYEREHG